MHLYISLGFYAFQSVLFCCQKYDLFIIHSSCFISGFGAGNKMTDSYVYILAMPSNFIKLYLLFYCNVQCLIMAMPFTIILIMYVIPCKLSCDFSKLTILYIVNNIVNNLLYTCASIYTCRFGRISFTSQQVSNHIVYMSRKFSNK